MNDEEQLELDIPEEPLTEEGLEEDIKKNEERNQRDYEENKYRNRELQRRQQERDNKQLDIPGIFEARSGARIGTGLAFEVGANSILDFFTPLPGSQAVGSAVINSIAQGIRGGKFSLGEVLGSAAASQIPGLAQGKAITTAGRFGKAAGTGALSGGIEATSIAAIDRGETPTFEEFALAVGAGGLLGAGFQKVGDSLDPKVLGAFRDLRARINGNESAFYLAGSAGAARPKGLLIDPADGDEFGTYLSDTDVYKTIQDWRKYKPSEQEVNTVRSTMLKFGMVGNRFDANIWRKGTKRDPKTGFKRFTANQERALISLFVTPPFTKANYNQVSKRVMPAFRKQYGPMLQALGIDPSDLQLHHMLPLKASIPLYHGLVYDSDEWWELTAFLLKRHIKAGDSADNLRKLIGEGKRTVQDETAPLANKERPLKTPHSISHQHVRDEFGEDGRKFFTQDVLDSIYDNQAKRLEVADLYTRKMRRNFDLTNQAEKIFNMTVGPTSKKFTMKEIVNTMTRMDEQGYLDLVENDYQVDLINDMILGIRKQGGGNEYMKTLDRLTEEDFNLKQNKFKQERLARNQDIDDFEQNLREMISRDKQVGFARVSNMNDAAVAAEDILEPMFKLPDGTFRSYSITLPNGNQGEFTYEMARDAVARIIFDMTNQ